MTVVSMVRRMWVVALIGVVAVGAVPRGVAAQATALPTFFAPVRGFGNSELGATFSRPNGNSAGLEGRLGFRLSRADLGLRAGLVDPGGTADGVFVVGVEARVPVLGHTRSNPLDGALILGVGRSFASGAGETFVPVGLSLGRRIVLDGSAFHLTPYAQPTVIFTDNTLVTMGLGLDLHIRGIPDVRANWAVGDLDGFSVSMFWGR